MKISYCLILALFSAAGVGAQSHFPYDSVRGQVVYTQSYKLNPKAKTEDVYASALAWFDRVSEFTHRNADPPVDTIKAKKNKRKAETEEQFDNQRPLQMQDPIGGRIMGMGIIRYYGSMNNCIKLLYIKYDIEVKVKADAAIVSVSNIHFFHYHPESYKQVPLYKFTGGRPCDQVGTIEYLLGCETFDDEFSGLALYCNKEINGHFDDFKGLLKQKKYLYDPTATAAVPVKTKTPAKPVAGKK